MGCFAHKFIFLVCLTVVATQPHPVSGLSSIDLALKGHYPFPRSRVLTQATEYDLIYPPSLAPTQSMVFHPDQSSKRRVRKGSDPIHNRC
ncbi:unnamed protein product [Amaranthus hypochondriacus]